jgi:hypothetical protein
MKRITNTLPTAVCQCPQTYKPTDQKYKYKPACFRHRLQLLTCSMTVYCHELPSMMYLETNNLYLIMTGLLCSVAQHLGTKKLKLSNECMNYRNCLRKFSHLLHRIYITVWENPQICWNCPAADLYANVSYCFIINNARKNGRCRYSCM